MITFLNIVYINYFSIGNCFIVGIFFCRVEILVMIFDRIIDIHNFEFINMVLNAEEQAAVLARIGGGEYFPFLC